MVSVLKQINNGEWGNFNAWIGTPHRVAGNNAAPVPEGMLGGLCTRANRFDEFSSGREAAESQVGTSIHSR